MKIFQIVHSLDVGGTERVVIDIVKNLSGQDFRFGVVCLDKLGVWGERLQKDGYSVYCLNRSPGLNFESIKRAVGIFSIEKPDVIHCHQYTPYFYGATAAFFAKKRPKIIFTEHGRHQPDKKRWKRILFNKLFLSRITDAITGVSEFSKESLVKYEGFNGDKISVIYNGLDLAKYNTSLTKEEARLKIRINKDTKIVGHIGRLVPVKDQKTLILAFQKLRQKRQDAILIIAGDGPLRNELEKFAADLGLAGAVNFLGTRSDIDILLKAFDVFVLSSISEATSVTAIEAMASGCPVVATDVGGNREVIGDNGILVEPRNPEPMAEAIEKILTVASNENKQSQIYAKISEKFQLEKMLGEYCELYKI